MVTDAALQRFFSFVRTADGGCWEWTGFVWKSGYACFWAEGRSNRAHRWAFLALRGEIPEGLEPDHLCRNKKCVNPWHLELVSHRENARRRNAVITHCRRAGHPLDGDNLYVDPRGRRECRECRNEALWRHKQKLAVEQGG
jgi:hypothetical protein